MKTKNSGALPDAVPAKAENEHSCNACDKPIEQGQRAYLPDYGPVHIACKQQMEEEDAAKRAWFAELGGLKKTRVQAIHALKEHLPFRLGDLLVEGVEKRYIPANDLGLVTANEYKTLELTTGYKVSSLQKFVYVARAFPPCIRMQQLSWSVHQVIAPLPTQEERRAMLERAAKGQGEPRFFDIIFE